MTCKKTVSTVVKTSQNQLACVEARFMLALIHWRGEGGVEGKDYSWGDVFRRRLPVGTARLSVGSLPRQGWPYCQQLHGMAQTDGQIDRQNRCKYDKLYIRCIFQELPEPNRACLVGVYAVTLDPLLSLHGIIYVTWYTRLLPKATSVTFR